MRSNEVFSCFVARELKKKTEIIKDEDEAKRISKELFNLVKEEQANNDETNKLFDLYFSFETEINREKALEKLHGILYGATARTKGVGDE